MPARTEGIYLATDIQVLSGVEAIRKRPAMYVGPLDDPTLGNRLLQEALCVARDDAAEGSPVSCHIRLEDFRAGITITGSALPTCERRGTILADTLMTSLFACRRERAPGHESLCQLGLCVLNALCESLFLSVADGTTWWHGFYQKGVAGAPFAKGLATPLIRTQMIFALDPVLLPEAKFNAEELRAWCKTLPFEVVIDYSQVSVSI